MSSKNLYKCVEQEKWVDEMLESVKGEIIFLGVHGSRLYGLETPDSDIDLKAVYAPSFEDLVIGKNCKTFNYKNDELDIEIEVKSVHEFLKSAQGCDTNCMDLLHAPDSAIIYEHEDWKTLRSHKSDLYAKNMKGLIGYIKTHAKKYSNKIDRLNEMKEVLKQVECLLLEDMLSNGSKTLTVKDVAESTAWKYFKYVKPVTLVQDHEQKYLEVCGKKYIYTWDVSQLISAMQNEIKRYGKRSNSGLDTGLDTKSLSHALRVLIQLKELLVKRNITFPLADCDYVKKVKLGQVESRQEVIDVIDNLYDECMMLLENSTDLPEHPSVENMKKVVVDYYKKGLEE